MLSILKYIMTPKSRSLLSEKKPLFTLFIFSLFCHLGNAQNPEIKRTNHWYFGGGAGIDFSSGTAVADTNGKMSVYAGCSVISDINGELQFYTNGETVWNRNHDTLKNGFGLYGGGTPYQGSVIAPQPGNDSIYFIFHQTGFDAGGNPEVYGLNYSVVNMKADSGRGEVIEKNHPLFKPNCEALAATHHANKCDVWIMGAEHHTNNWHAFLVTANGVDTTPVTTVIGNHIPDSSLINYDVLGLSLIRFSPNMKKLATGMFWDNISNTALFDTLELYDFDNSTGILSNKIAIGDSLVDGIQFSQDNTKLYYGSGVYDAQIYQLDISSNNPDTILSTKTLLYYDEYWNITDFQLTIDNKIIGARPLKDSVAVIASPNSSGLGCNFIANGLSLNGRYGYTALPNFIQSYFGEDTTGCYPTSIEEFIQETNDGLLVYPNPFSEYTTIHINSEFRMQDAELRLYDVLGREVFFSELRTPNSELKRNNLQSGIYFLSIKIGNNNFNHKLIITN